MGNQLILLKPNQCHLGVVSVARGLSPGQPCSLPGAFCSRHSLFLASPASGISTGLSALFSQLHTLPSRACSLAFQGFLWDLGRSLPDPTSSSSSEASLPWLSAWMVEDWEAVGSRVTEGLRGAV